MKAAIAIICAFLGCCTTVAIMELLVKDDPGSGNLVTFAQFLFIAVEGFIFTSKCGTVKPTIGLKDYFILVSLFFVTNVCNNYAYDFNISVPLHMIFRAGSLITNMIMGIIILKKKYIISKYLSVLMITIGITICTIVSGKEVKSLQGKHVEKVETTPYEDFFWWTIGITILTIALFISSALGIYQEVLHARYGKRPREALYYTHLLPLPFFLILASNIYNHFLVALKSSPLIVILIKTDPEITLAVPKLVFYVLVNVLTQYVCIRSVFTLTAECSSLTVTLVVTLRKFISLTFSIIYFQNPFTVYHWIGTILVFVGTVIFTEVIPKISQSLGHVQEKKVQ